MKTVIEILSEVDDILSTKWQTRDGRQVPESTDIKLGNDSVTFDGTVLYADMRGSTELVNGFKNWFAAEIYKCYLTAACYIVRNNSGTITAFDGDRIMAVYIGDSKNTSAAKTALQIHFIVKEINNKIKIKYPTTAFQLDQSVGIDTSNLFIAKTGIRVYNDLVWVGRSANFAAKLSTLNKSDYKSYITDDVFKFLADEAKNGGNPKRCMWDKIYWEERGIYIYASNWWWQP